MTVEKQHDAVTWPVPTPALHKDKVERHHLHLDQQLGRQGDEAQAEGARQQNPLGGGPDTSQQRRTGVAIIKVC
jgi:hypothetical protein